MLLCNGTFVSRDTSKTLSLGLLSQDLLRNVMFYILVRLMALCRVEKENSAARGMAAESGRDV